MIADESLATLYRTEAGYWEPWGKTMASDASTAYRIPSAAYDFYWIEFMEHPYTNAAVRVLGASGGVTLAPRTVSDLTFARRYERGTAGIKGTIRGMKVPGTDELRKAGSVAGIHVLIAPRINIYDVRGDYRGTAFVRVAGEEFTGLVDALERGDDAAVKAAFRPREYAIQGFPPGRYRVQIVAYGSPLREREVLLTEGRTLRLDIDFDRF